MNKDHEKIEIPDIVIDPKNPSKRKFQKGKFLGRVCIGFNFHAIFKNSFYKF